MNSSTDSLRRTFKSSARVLAAAFFLSAVTAWAAPVPTALADLGEAAEETHDAVAGSKWDAVAKDLADLQKAHGSLAAEQPAAAKAFAAPIAALAAASKAKDRLAAQEAANELTRLSAEACRAYEPPFPVEISLLDYLGREINLQLAKNDPAGIKKSVAAVRANWDKVRAAVEAHKGTKQSQAFSALLVELEKATEPKKIGELTRNLLDQVDDLEKVFH